MNGQNCLRGLGAFRRLWWRGGFPPSFLAENDVESRNWRANFIQTFLERDLRRFGVQVAPTALGKFWNMIAHADLGLKRVYIVHPGKESYELNDWAESIAIGDLRLRVFNR